MKRVKAPQYRGSLLLLAVSFERHTFAYRIRLKRYFTRPNM